LQHWPCDCPPIRLLISGAAEAKEGARSVGHFS
jgi:hypothetical protein